MCGSPAPSSAWRGCRSSRARGQRTRRAAAGTSFGCPARTREWAGTQRGPRADRVRVGVTPLHPSPRRSLGLCLHLPLSRRWEVSLGRARGAGMVARWLGQDVGGAANPGGPAQLRTARAGSSGSSLQGAPRGLRPAGTLRPAPVQRRGGGGPSPKWLSLRLSEMSGGVLRLGDSCHTCHTTKYRRASFPVSAAARGLICWEVCLLAAGLLSTLGSGMGSLAFPLA